MSTEKLSELSKPVAYAVFADNGNIRIWSTDKGITDNVGVSVPLFTSPPAPAVPEEMKRDPDADVFDPGFMNGWIACSERMPDDGVVVLCCEGGDVSTLFHRGNGVWDDGDFHSHITGVTHWMPLPAVPGVVK